MARAPGVETAHARDQSPVRPEPQVARITGAPTADAIQYPFFASSFSSASSAFASNAFPSFIASSASA